MLRFATSLVALTALALPAAAQQGRPPATPAPAQGGARPAGPPPGPPPVFPCRTAGEVCFLGVVIGNQVGVLYTNAEKAEGIEAKPVDVFTGAGPGAPLDLRPHAGRIVMLVGDYDPKVGLVKAELVEVASPLLSLTIKGLVAGGDEAPEPPPPAQGGKGAAPAPRR